MTDTDELLPAPAALAALAVELVEGRWPRDDAGREALFDRLGFTSGEKFGDPHPGDTELFQLATQLTGDLFSTWSALAGRFMGVTFQSFMSMRPDNPGTRRGYDDIRSRLTARYGEPGETWGAPDVPNCLWHVNGRDMAMHFFNGRDSGMMLSVDDSELAALAEAAAEKAARSRVLPPELVEAMRRREQGQGGSRAVE